MLGYNVPVINLNQGASKSNYGSRMLKQEKNSGSVLGPIDMSSRVSEMASETSKKNFRTNTQPFG